MKRTAVILLSIVWCAVALFAVLCAVLFSLYDGNIFNRDGTALSAGESTTAQVTDTPAETSAGTVAETPVATEADMFSSRDEKAEYSESDAVKISLTGSGATASDSSVVVDGSVITVTGDKTYVVSGKLDNGRIVVNAEDTAKPHIIFADVNIASASSAALYIISADKVFVTVVGECSLENGGSFEAADENSIDGAVFSKQDLTFNGTGSLNISSPAGHGIVCKDDLVFTGGTYIITSASHAIDANDSVRIKNSDMQLTSGKDGIHSENSDNGEKGFVYVESGKLAIACEGDGISAGAYVQLCSGDFDILAGGGYENGEKKSSDAWGGFGGGFGGPGGRPGGRTSSAAESSEDESSTSMKGIKAVGNILISGGNFKIDSADDGLHSDTSVNIAGGSFEIANGDDAVHGEENLTLTGGDISITESYEGLEALHIGISGGNIRLKASDDGLNAAGGTDSSGAGGRDGMFGGAPGGMGGSSNGSIKISGGNLYVNASGDGIDANGTVEISGGYTVLTGPTSGDTAVLDYDKSATITGGTFIGTGSSMMAQTFSASEQGVIGLSVGSRAAGTEIAVKDSNGEILLTHTPELDYQIMIVSTPEMVSGKTYTVEIGTDSGEFEAA